MILKSLLHKQCGLEKLCIFGFRGGLGEASVSKASPNEEKSINQLSKNGEHYRQRKKIMFGDMLKKPSEFAEQLRKVDVVKDKIENTLMY